MLTAPKNPHSGRLVYCLTFGLTLGLALFAGSVAAADAPQDVKQANPEPPVNQQTQTEAVSGEHESKATPAAQAGKDGDIPPDDEEQAQVTTDAGVASAQQEATPASPDEEQFQDALYPHIQRATVVSHYYASYDLARVPVGAIEESAIPGDSAIVIAGELAQEVYGLPENISKARAHTFYLRELRNNGFDIVFSCLGPRACGAGFGHYVNAGGPVVNSHTDYIGYAPFSAITARRSAFFGDTYVFIYSGEHDHHQLFEQIVTTNDALTKKLKSAVEGK